MGLKAHQEQQAQQVLQVPLGCREFREVVGDLGCRALQEPMGPMGLKAHQEQQEPTE